MLWGSKALQDHNQAEAEVEEGGGVEEGAGVEAGVEGAGEVRREGECRGLGRPHLITVDPTLAADQLQIVSFSSRTMTVTVQ